MRDWKVIVAKNVQKLRQQRKLTQEQLAFAARIDLTCLVGDRAWQKEPQPIGNGSNCWGTTSALAEIVDDGLSIAYAPQHMLLGGPT
jgi:hypothetical protein